MGDLPRAERRVGTISEIMGFDEDDSNSADPPKGAGAVEGNAAAPSCETIPDEGKLYFDFDLWISYLLDLG